MPTLTDNDHMPFGKHKGLPMSEVPAEYLQWFLNKTKDHALAKMTLSEKLVRKYAESKQQKPL